MRVQCISGVNQVALVQLWELSADCNPTDRKNAGGSMVMPAPIQNRTTHLTLSKRIFGFAVCDSRIANLDIPQQDAFLNSYNHKLMNLFIFLFFIF